MRRRPLVLLPGLLGLLLLAALLAGCGGSEGSDGSDGPGSGGSGATLHVSAAASLTDVFGALAKTFEKQHPGTKVVTDFGPSSGLAEQIAAGSPTDVFASASTETMQQLVDRKLVSAPKDFAANRAMIAVPRDNPGHVRTLQDLTRKDVKVALCDETVPCGKAADTSFEAAGVKVTPVTREEDVRAVLTKVSLGEVDAGIVYVTDVRAVAGRGRVRGIAIPPGDDAHTTYPIATVRASKQQHLAREFAALVAGPTGRAALHHAGFLRP